MTDAVQKDEITALKRLVQSLQEKVEQLEAKAAPTGDARQPSFDRRLLLKGAGIAAAATAVGVGLAGNAAPAGAVVDPNLILNEENTATGATNLEYTGGSAPGAVLLVQDSTDPPASSFYESCVAGWANGIQVGNGVYGYTTASNGAGVIGWGNGAHCTGVLADGGNQGVAAVDATIASGGRAVIATNTGTGQGVWAKLSNGANTKDCVRAETVGTGTGIYASSVNGAGAKFQGKTAQVVLVPSGVASHPPSGVAGTLFVDNKKRLWFCRGGSSWYQLA